MTIFAKLNIIRNVTSAPEIPTVIYLTIISH